MYVCCYLEINSVFCADARHSGAVGRNSACYYYVLCLIRIILTAELWNNKTYFITAYLLIYLFARDKISMLV